MKLIAPTMIALNIPIFFTVKLLCTTGKLVIYIHYITCVVCIFPKYIVTVNLFVLIQTKYMQYVHFWGGGRIGTYFPFESRESMC
jgi:hypothetical protein